MDEDKVHDAPEKSKGAAKPCNTPYLLVVTLVIPNATVGKRCEACDWMGHAAGADFGDFSRKQLPENQLADVIRYGTPFQF